MNNKYDFFFSTDKGKIRDNNEDFYGEKKLSKGHVFVVCDGVGGHSGGEIASQKAVECILDYFTRSKGENAVQMIHESIKFANSQVHGFASTYPEYKGMGTTCVVVYITDSGYFYYGHVGDSRLYLSNKGGLKALTKDHSYVQYLVDIGEIKESEMETHPSKNQILRALGSDEVVKPEVSIEPLFPKSGDIFLLCSDGLNGMIGNEKIQKVLNSKNETPSLLEKADKLIQSALDAGGKDNVTVGLIEFVSEEQEKTLQFPSSKDSNRFLKVKKYIVPTVILILFILGALFFLKTGKGEKSGMEETQKQEMNSPQAQPSVGKPSNKKVDLDTTLQKAGVDSESITVDENQGSEPAKQPEKAPEKEKPENRPLLL